MIERDHTKRTHIYLECDVHKITIQFTRNEVNEVIGRVTIHYAMLCSHCEVSLFCLFV